ncbi:MAG: serine/threonine protein kinase [Coriobacteriales bacterium]|jgi:serine/threonine protein kinase
MGDEATDELASFVSSFDSAQGYTTKRLIDQNAAERTELVSDESGALFVRKYIKGVSAGTHPYEWLAESKAAHLPDVVTAFRVGDTLVVVERWQAGQTIADLVEQGNVSLADAQRVFSDVCDAVESLHTAPAGPFIHRDINPSNVIYDGTSACLIDLGIARRFRPEASGDTTLMGTAGYAAPEQFGFKQTGVQADVYALGMLLRFMLSGAGPEDALDHPLPKRLAEVVDRATQFDPELRYQSVRQLSHAAQSAFEQAKRVQSHERKHTETIQKRSRRKERKSAWLSSLRGLTGRSAAARRSWRIWCAVYWVWTAAFTVSEIYEGAIVHGLPYSPAYNFLVWVFVIAIPGFFFADVLGLTRKIPVFCGPKRYARLLIGFLSAELVCMVLMIVVAG